jgi:hypothetical protein
MSGTGGTSVHATASGGTTSVGTSSSGGTMMMGAGGMGGMMTGTGGMMMGTGGMTMGTGGAMMMGTGGMPMGHGGSMMMGTGGMMMGMGGMHGAGGMMATGGMQGADAGATCHSPGTIMVTANSAHTAYIMEGMSNPTLTLCRGSTYTFSINATGHPFYIKTMHSTGTANAYSTGVTGNGAEMGDVVFVVPASAPNMLVYDCSVHSAMTGTIDIVN